MVSDFYCLFTQPFLIKLHKEFIQFIARRCTLFSSRISDVFTITLYYTHCMFLQTKPLHLFFLEHYITRIAAKKKILNKYIL